MTDTNRAEFEDAYLANEAEKHNEPLTTSNKLYMLRRYQHGVYQDPHLESRWEGWQAASAKPERVALSDAEILKIASTHGLGWAEGGKVTQFLGDEDIAQYYVAFARAILAAQADVPETDFGNMMQNFCADCGKRNFADHIHTCSPPLTQPPIADAAREYDGIAHEIWAAAQLIPGEGITDGVDRIESIIRNLDDVAVDARDAAVRFAGMVLAAHRNDGYPGDVDGADLERMALECGMTENRVVTERCGETCACAEYGETLAFPTKCLFTTDAGKAAIAASKEAR